MYFKVIILWKLRFINVKYLKPFKKPLSIRKWSSPDIPCDLTFCVMEGINNSKKKKYIRAQFQVKKPNSKQVRKEKFIGP